MEKAFTQSETLCRMRDDLAGTISLRWQTTFVLQQPVQAKGCDVKAVYVIVQQEVINLKRTCCSISSTLGGGAVR